MGRCDGVAWSGSLKFVCVSFEGGYGMIVGFEGGGVRVSLIFLDVLICFGCFTQCC